MEAEKSKKLPHGPQSVIANNDWVIGADIAIQSDASRASLVLSTEWQIVWGQQETVLNVQTAGRITVAHDLMAVIDTC